MGTEVTKYEEQWAEKAKAKAQKEAVASSTISHRSGKFTAGDMEFPELCVIILSDIHENAYYSAGFDPDQLTPPSCFAFGAEENEMSPHENVLESDYFKPESEDCASCPFNQWGSADKGRGKACKNSRRMSIIPAGVYKKIKGSRDLDRELFIEGEDSDADAQHVLNAEAYTLKIPPTSIKGYKKYVNMLSSEFNRPPQGVVTRIYTEPMDNGGHELIFEPLFEVPGELFPAITKREEDVQTALRKPYTPPDGPEGEAVERTVKSRSRLKGLRRKR